MTFFILQNYRTGPLYSVFDELMERYTRTYTIYMFMKKIAEQNVYIYHVLLYVFAIYNITLIALCGYFGQCLEMYSKNCTDIRVIELSFLSIYWQG